MPKIETCGPQGVPATLRTRPADAPLAGATSGKPAAAVTAGDSLNLTGDALRLQQLAQAAAAAPDVDLRRVAETREKLRDASYDIRPQVIAARLARLECELSPP